MTNNIDKIRAFVDLMRNHAIAVAYGRQLYAADSALAELERAAAEPVAWMWNDELGIPHASAGSKKPVWLESSASAEYIKQANLRPLYAAPPAPVAEIRDVVVTDEMCDRAYIGKWRGVPELIGHEPDDEDRQWSREWLEAWRAELGPALGLETRRHRDNEIDALEQKLARADARIAKLERECTQWRDELRIYRETENSRIAELEQAVTVRDTEIARLRDALDQSALEYADLAVSAKSLEEHLGALVEVSDDSTIARARAVMNGDDIGEDEDEARAGNGGGV